MDGRLEEGQGTRTASDELAKRADECALQTLCVCGKHLVSASPRVAPPACDGAHLGSSDKRQLPARLALHLGCSDDWVKELRSPGKSPR